MTESSATTPAAEPTRILVIAAHPDDPEFGAGGTTGAWTQQGREVHYLLCTRGDKGTDDPSLQSEDLMQLREQEQRAAAAVLGVREVTFLNFRDGELAPTLDLRGQIVYAIRRVRPDIVITHDPATIYGTEFINHPDHRAVGTATLDAVYPTARDRLQYPEQLAQGLSVHKVKEVYMWGSLDPNAFVDIGSSFDLKMAALRKHASQVKSAEGLVERMRERARQIGEPQGIALAEGFRRVVLAR